MRLVLSLFSLSLLISSSAAACISYTVAGGDTCSKIASSAGITVSQLLSFNPSINSGCTNLSIGAQLCVSAPTTTTTQCARSVTVASGNTCSSIASAAGISTSTLLTLNPSVNSGCTNLAIGQVLCVASGNSPATPATSTTTAVTTAPPPSTGCAKSVTVKSGDTCSGNASAAGISTATLLTLNSAVNSGCTNLAIGQVLCVAAGAAAPTTTTIPVTTTSPVTTAPASNGCAKSVTVQSGNTCASIASAAGITTSTLQSLNPAINSGCTNLAIGQILCVTAGVAAPTTTTRPTTSAPAPTGCSKSVTVQSGNTCAGIASAAGISTATLLSLNPSVNSGCTNLAIGQVLCVTAGAAAPTTTTTNPATTTTSPTTGCSRSVTVQSGNTCAGIASAAGITVAQLISFNPVINSACSNLAIGQVLCLTQGSTPTTASSSTSSTSPAAPSSTSCSRSVIVKSGDTCSAIATAAGITFAQIIALNPAVNSACSNLAIGQVLCVAAGSGTAPSGCSRSVTVQSGDTCTSIATAAGTTFAQIVSLNPSVNSACSNLSIGQVLCVAGTASTTTTTANTPTETGMVVPLEPAPQRIYRQGSACPIVWKPDTADRSWERMEIALMTGPNLSMTKLYVVATLNGSDPNLSTFTWTCPQVNPNSAIYFYQFTNLKTGVPTWTGRFTISDVNGNTVAPQFSTQPDGSPIPYGNGLIVKLSTRAEPMRLLD